MMLNEILKSFTYQCPHCGKLVPYHVDRGPGQHTCASALEFLNSTEERKDNDDI